MPRDRLKYQASPVAMVRASASAFIWATISTSPVPASVVTQVTKPLASNLGVSASPSSRSEAVCAAVNMLSDIAMLQRLHGAKTVTKTAGRNAGLSPPPASTYIRFSRQQGRSTVYDFAMLDEVYNRRI